MQGRTRAHMEFDLLVLPDRAIQVGQHDVLRTHKFICMREHLSDLHGLEHCDHAACGLDVHGSRCVANDEHSVEPRDSVEHFAELCRQHSNCDAHTIVDLGAQDILDEQPLQPSTLSYKSSPRKKPPNRNSPSVSASRLWTRQ